MPDTSYSNSSANGWPSSPEGISDVSEPSSTSLMLDYDARVFRSVANSDGGDVGAETTFHYHQRDDVVWATYAGGSVVFGTLLAKVDALGNLDMRYQHVSIDGEFKAGRCDSRPETLPDGRLRLDERWRWTDGAEGQGVSIVEEVQGP